jgi:glycosyltransferase involved in cell wall biosynthesis
MSEIKPEAGQPVSPGVSVVLPCYNAGADLPRAIASVRAQSVSGIEIVVVDDGSTDPETLAVLDTLPGDVRVVRQVNKGLPAARNAGFAAARGPLVFPLDSDDTVEPRFVEKALAALRADPRAGYACSQLRVRGAVDGVLRKQYNFFEQLFSNQLPYCLLLPKDTWKSVGGYDETMRNGYEDWEFNIRLGEHGHFGAVVAEPLFVYHVKDEGMLRALSRRRHAELWREIQQRHPGLYTVPALLRCWRQWRGRPSTYPLPVYAALLLVHRLLPAAWFNALFRQLLRLSSAERAR